MMKKEARGKFMLSEIMGGNKLIQAPGDEIIQRMTPNGNIITKIKTKTVNATHRQYRKKDGSKGKQTLLFKEIDR